jgi:hypothetical protein
MSDEVPSWMVGSGLETDMSSGGGATKNNSALRFWMPKGSSKKVIFLTDGDKAPVIWEHQFKVNGSWKNWLTCLGPTGQECPFCKWSEANDNEFRRYKAAFFTVIDCSEYTDRNGVTHRNTKRLMCCKSGTADKIKRKWMRMQEEGKSLVGAQFEIYRTNSDKSPSVGEDFEYIKHVDLGTLEDHTEFDYKTLLAPNEDAARLAIDQLKEERGVSESRHSADVPF